MFDAHSKEDLKRSLANLSNQGDTTAVLYEVAAVLRALLIQEISTRPDDPKPAEETPAENPVEASDDEPQSRRKVRERA